MAKKVTLADIAAEVGVSSVAVHKALTDKPGVSAEMRRKIKETAKRMDYRNGRTENAKTDSDAEKTGNIGVLMPDRYSELPGSFYGKLYEQVVKALYQHDYYGILELLTKEDAENRTLPRILREEKVDGLILLGVTDKRYMEAIAEQSRKPLFFLDTYHPDSGEDAVISDGYRGTYMLTSYLIARGHRKIGFVGTVDATSSIADRYWGYRRALREHGIAYQDAWEIPDRDGQGGIYRELMEEPGDFDAVVCNCDMAAHLLVQNLEERGFLIPRDLSVVGFDDFLPSGIEEDRITSYQVDMERMAEVCVKSLIRKIHKKKYTRGIQTVSGQIIYRKSVKDSDRIAK